MDKYDHFKLKIDAKPSLFHTQTVRKAVGVALWGKIRKEVLQNCEPTSCSIYHIMIKHTGFMFMKKRSMILKT